MLTSQDIIDWKLAYLNGENQAPMSSEMRAMLDADAALQDELAFIEQFWIQTETVDEQPSAQLDANFYQMLSNAQASQHTVPTPTAEKQEKSSWLADIMDWFAPKPVAQFAALGLVFVLGYNLNQPQMNAEADPQLAGLQEEVSSLSAMLAMSMLQKSSASERLTGVAYSKQSDLSNPLLIDKLLKLLANDRSTAVRLSIISTFSMLPDVYDSEQQLLEIAVNETNAMVQLELCRLLLNGASEATQAQLIALAEQQKLNPEVNTLLNEISEFTQI